MRKIFMIGGIIGIVTIAAIAQQNNPNQDVGPATSAARPATSDGDQMWVTSDRLNRRTCPSTNCGIVGRYFFREAASIFESKDDWARVTRYYQAACKEGVSIYVDSGNARCVPENGIVDGEFAEWVALGYLSTERPPDPAAGATGLDALIAGSDDYRKHRQAFASAAETLISSGRCREADFIENGGFVKSYNRRDEAIYFMYCGGSMTQNRLYLNAVTGKIFR